MAAYYNGGRTMSYSNTDGCFDGGRTMYSNTTADECYDAGRNGRGGMNMYSNTTEEECYGGEQGQQGYYKKEEKTHKNRERMGEVGALATGAFAMYEGYEAKKDLAHAQKHKIEASLAGAAALGAGGYVFHEHREQKQASYGGGAHHQEHRVPAYNQYCN